MVPPSRIDEVSTPPSSGRRSPTLFKFPDFASPDTDHLIDEDSIHELSREPSPLPLPKGLPAGLHSSNRWPARKHQGRGGWSAYDIGANGELSGRGHQKSLSEAIRNVRTRKMSISENAQEIAESLKAPVSYKLVILCMIWFSTSILSNASSKAILTALPRPVTLTLMQFALVSFWCVLMAWLAKHSPTLRNAAPVLRNGIRRPTKEIIMTTLPLTGFQIGGHILNSDAMSRLPVMLVHTIKGLAPLMTVFAYRCFLNTRYSRSTYLSLIPLTLGVIMACSASFQSNVIGLLGAVGSTILFVTQNIVSKSIFEDATKAEQDGVPLTRRKPDKLTLLCYSSLLAFTFTFPIWLWSDAFPMLREYFQAGAIELRKRPGSLDHGALTLEFMVNGTFHFGQSLIAFVLLGLVSPVTYSVASLIKRVAVIIFAIVWWAKPMSTLQGLGFVLTFIGLYLYDRTSDADKVDKRFRAKQASTQPLLPLRTSSRKKRGSDDHEPHPTSADDSPVTAVDMKRPFSASGGYANGTPVGSGPGRPRGSSNPNSAPHVNGVPVSVPQGTIGEPWGNGDQHSFGIR